MLAGQLDSANPTPIDSYRFCYLTDCPSCRGKAHDEAQVSVQASSFFPVSASSSVDCVNMQYAFSYLVKSCINKSTHQWIPIVGGVVGGIVAIGLIVGSVFCIKKHCQNRDLN